MNNDKFGAHLVEFDETRFSISQQDFLELRARSNEFVFVVGSARSATTILAEIINMQRDCFMLMEDNPFINHYMPDYVTWYRNMTQEAGSKMAKGFYLPSFCSRNIRWAKTYLLLKENYRFVGGKIAFGPHDYWENVRSNFLDFYISIFPDAAYFGCLRHPVDCIESMAIMFTDRCLKKLLETWIYSALYLVYLSCLVDRFFLIINERLSEKFVNHVMKQSGIGQFDYLDKILIQKKHSGQQISELLLRQPLVGLLGEQAASYKPLLDEAVELYSDICNNFSEVDSTLNPDCQRTQFSALMDQRLRELLRKVHTLYPS